MARWCANTERAKTETIHHVRWEVPMAKVNNNKAAVKDEETPDFSGQPFSAVFQQARCVTKNKEKTLWQ